MDTSISPLDGVDVGRVFTPRAWAEWLLLRWGVFDAWLDGAVICDPTAGEGAFALALLDIARTRGVTITADLLGRLTLIEVCAAHLETFKTKALRDYGVDFPPSRLVVQDVITDRHDARYDIVVGNPPWANFTDLPSAYKQQLKSYFVAEGLVPDARRVLLGASRVDIAALVLKIALGRLLRPNGLGCFYLPLSLFQGDDAHRGFRDYIANHRPFAVEQVYEFNQTKVFDKVGTAYGCARFRMDLRQRFPVRYFREGGGQWIEHAAVPLREPDDPWRVIDHAADSGFEHPITVRLSPAQKPRQGVNTCGATDVFVFDSKPAALPDAFLFPLASKEIWRSDDRIPHRWILLPYDRTTGKTLAWAEIERHDALKQHLCRARQRLESRKGTLIRSAIDKGHWWSLLGVGSYSFAPYKVIWEAYGGREFKPVILDEAEGNVWQANQAMHAFIPCWSRSDAEAIHGSLLNPAIPALLRQLNGEGKCNWAQPGKIRKILTFDKPTYRQALLFR